MCDVQAAAGPRESLAALGIGVIHGQFPVLSYGALRLRTVRRRRRPCMVLLGGFLLTVDGGCAMQTERTGQFVQVSVCDVAQGHQHLRAREP